VTMTRSRPWKRGLDRAHAGADRPCPFYTDNFLALWERTLRGIAAANINNIGDSALLFALAKYSAADATITAWADKRHWIPGDPSRIREGEDDGNRRTAGDPTWVP